jgi:hypothetical protein
MLANVNKTESLINIYILEYNIFLLTHHNLQ